MRCVVQMIGRTPVTSLLVATLVFGGCTSKKASVESPPPPPPLPKTSSPPAQTPSKPKPLADLRNIWPAQSHRVVSPRASFSSPKATGSVFCVRTLGSAVPPAASALHDQVALGGPCWGAFRSESEAEQHAKRIGTEYAYVVRLPARKIYRHEGAKYEVAEAPFLVELGYIEDSFTVSRPLERDTVVVETGYCFHCDSYRGPAFVLDAPTGLVHLFPYVWGMAPAGPNKLFLSLGLIVGKLSEDLTPVIAALAKRFDVSPARVKEELFAQGDADPENTPVELTYLAELDLQTGKLRELPVIGGTEMWFTGEEVFSLAYPSLCRRSGATVGGVHYLSRNPMKWIEATREQAEAAIESPLKARSMMAAVKNTAAVGKPITLTRDRSTGLFVAGWFFEVERAVLHLGRRSSKAARRKR